MKNKKNKNLKVLLVTLITVIVMGVICIADNSFISSAVNGLTKGLFQITASATSSIDTIDSSSLKTENEQLKKENAALREQLADYYDLKAENERLKKYYEIKEQNPSYTICPANVIMRNANDDFYSFTLDIGSSDGVAVNNPVITENGLVGRVYKVDATTCIVKTILSPDVKISASNKQTGGTGIITGNATLCDDNLTSLTKITDNTQFNKGDLIVTSGEGGVYPKNLIIGKVSEIRFNTYDASYYAVIEPYESISSLTAAAVITNFDSNGGAKQNENQ